MTRPAPRALPGGLLEGPALSVVVPAWNEARSLPLLAARVAAVLADHDSWELIVVDDGSTDDSVDALAAVRATTPRARTFRLAQHQGKSAALAAGLRASRGRVVVTMDADLQDLPEEIPTLLAALEERGLDVVQAWRVAREDAAHKVLASWVFNRLCSGFSGLGLHDVNCGFKALRRPAAAALRLGADLHRFVPVLLHRQGFRVGEVPVRHARRAFGRSRYGLGRYLRGFSDLISVVLLPRLLRALAPISGPLGVLGLLGSIGAGAVLLVHLATGRVGLRFELALTALGLGLGGVVALTLGALGRTGVPGAGDPTPAPSGVHELR